MREHIQREDQEDAWEVKMGSIGAWDMTRSNEHMHMRVSGYEERSSESKEECMRQGK